MYPRMGKRICLLFDGTWNKRDDHTNVRAMRDAIFAPQGSEDAAQPVWYDEGVGTHWYDKVRGGLFGMGLSRNLRQGYERLCSKHREGDEIFVFGFSRGAYTARSLVGMVRKCGVLTAPDENEVAAAYELYRDKEVAPKDEKAERFRRERAREVRVKFIGVWDTVGSLGIPGNTLPFSRKHYQWHDTALSKIVDHAYHAIATDEDRKDFAPTLWTVAKPQNKEVQQVWFIGAHSDVGGGYKDGRLQRFALRWMQDKAEACGLVLKDKASVGPDLHRAPQHDPYGKMLLGIYKMLHRRHPREFGKAANETVDPSVWRRWRAENYRPEPLQNHPDKPV